MNQRDIIITMKKNPLTNLQREELVRSILEDNIDEQLTLCFEKDNGVDFDLQTPDEIAAIMLNRMNIKYNE